MITFHSAMRCEIKYLLQKFKGVGNMSKVHCIKLEHDEDNGDTYMPIPEEILTQLDLRPGDTITWTEGSDGQFFLTKKVAVERPKIKSADGIEGHILFSGVTNKPYFRVYDFPNFSYTDYQISHHDLVVTIKDKDAFFYSYPDDTFYLDHSPDTLGYKVK